MGQTFKETAHLKTDMDKYGENYDRIFGKKKEYDWKQVGNCPLCGGYDDGHLACPHEEAKDNNQDD